MYFAIRKTLSREFPRVLVRRSQHLGCFLGSDKRRSVKRLRSLPLKSFFLIRLVITVIFVSFLALLHFQLHISKCQSEHNRVLNQFINSIGNPLIQNFSLLAVTSLRFSHFFFENKNLQRFKAKFLMFSVR